jgi:hypothetical protein
MFILFIIQYEELAEEACGEQKENAGEHMQKQRK